MKRGPDSAFREVASFVVDPASHDVRRKPVASRGKVWTILENGPPETKIDLLVLGDGYTAEEMPAFHDDARRLVEVLFSTPPFKERRYLQPLRHVLQWEPNFTAQLHPAALKWKDLLDPKTPIPTPSAKEEYEKFSAGIQVRLDPLLKPEAFLTDGGPVYHAVLVRIPVTRRDVRQSSTQQLRLTALHRASMTGRQVVKVLDPLTRAERRPRPIRVNNGPEFIAKAPDHGPSGAARNSISSEAPHREGHAGLEGNLVKRPYSPTSAGS